MGESKDKLVGKYTLLKLLAQGGMAEIHLAQETGIEGFERVVVLKRILPNVAQDPEFLTLFLDEARLAARLQHPNIAHVYDFGKANDFHFLAMEHVDGVTLEAILGAMGPRRFPAEHALKIVSIICEALEYAHTLHDERGQPMKIVHRDVSPDNVMVSWGGVVKVLDFGIAKASTQLRRTQWGQLRGKVEYMAPEQFRLEPLDARTDVFSTGVVLYELLSGKGPFERPDPAAVMNAVLTRPPPPIGAMRPDLPGGVDELLSRALARSPAARFQSAGEMQFAIDHLLADSKLFSSAPLIAGFLADLFDRKSVVAPATTLTAKSLPPPKAPDEPAAQSDQSVATAHEPEPDSSPTDLSLHVEPDRPMPTVHKRGPLASEATAPVWRVPLSAAAVAVFRSAGWPSKVMALGGLLLLTVPLLWAALGASGSGPVAAPTGPTIERPPSTPTQASAAPSTGPTIERPSSTPAQASTAASAGPASVATQPPTAALAATGTSKVAPSERRHARSQPGQLFVNSEPWANVQLDGRSLGTTPILGRAVPPGSHVLTLVDSQGRRHTERVEVVSGQATKRFVRLGPESHHRP